MCSCLPTIIEATTQCSIGHEIVQYSHQCRWIQLPQLYWWWNLLNGVYIVLVECIFRILLRVLFTLALFVSCCGLILQWWQLNEWGTEFQLQLEENHPWKCLVVDQCNRFSVCIMVGHLICMLGKLRYYQGGVLLIISLKHVLQPYYYLT